MEPITSRHVLQILSVIENVCTIASTVTANKPQCKRIADRFHAISEGLLGVGQDQNFVGGKAIDSSGISKDYPDLHSLLLVLREGEALVLQCRGIVSAIIRTDKQLKAFQKIHAKLDAFKSQFDFEGYRFGFAKDCDTTSGTVTGEARQQEGGSLTSDSEGRGDVLVPEYLRINPSDIRFLRNIGSGASAKVYEATWLGLRCAVKRFDSACMSIEYIPKLQKELDFLMQIRHPYTVQLLGLAVDSQQRCSIVMELMSCSLRKLIVSRMKNWNRVVPFDFHEAILIIKKVAYGMAFLHSNGISHRDLKSRNVMVEEHPGNIVVKIVDFGESQFMDLSNTCGTAGTTAWMAPEILPRPLAARSSEPCNFNLKAADVYSFAMTCYEVLTGEEPFSGILYRNQYDDVRTGKLRPNLPDGLHSMIEGLIKACWSSDIENRPNFEAICYGLKQIKFAVPAIVTNPSTGQDVSKLQRLFIRLSGLVQGTAPGVPKSCDEEPLMYDDRSENECESVSEYRSKGPTDGRLSAISVPEWLKINPGKLRFTNRVICMGTSSRVYAATWHGLLFAVKQVYMHDYSEREAKLMIELRHPHIVQLVGISVDLGKKCCWIMMEFISYNLQELIESRMLKWNPVHLKGEALESETLKSEVLESVLVVPFDIHEAVIIIRKIALGMVFLHSRGVVHNNLNPKTVMVDESHGTLDVKIVDFAQAKRLDSRTTNEEVSLFFEAGVDQMSHFFRPLSHPQRTVTDDYRWYSEAGYGFYRAPDVLPVRQADWSSMPNLKAVDVYSFAMICYQVVTGKTPFLGRESKYYKAVVAGDRPTLPHDLYPDLKILIEKCWHGDPWQRPDFKYICEELQRIQLALPTSSW